MTLFVKQVHFDPVQVLLHKDVRVRVGLCLAFFVMRLGYIVNLDLQSVGVNYADIRLCRVVLVLIIGDDNASSSLNLQ